MGVIYFNGISSKDIGIEVETYPRYEIPEKNVTTYEIPGRNGNIVVDNGTFKNAITSYDVSFLAEDGEYNSQIHKIAAWLYSPSGYAILEDSYDIEYYRMARISSSTDFENLFNKAGKATLEFDCKPQRFLKDGDKTRSINSETGIIEDGPNSSIFISIELHNPTLFSSYPIIKIYNQSKLNSAKRITHFKVGDTKINFSDLIQDATELAYDLINIVIDFETHNAYYYNSNDKLSKKYALSGYAYSKLFDKCINLVPGDNIIKIHLPSNSAKDSVYMEIIPRWWTL